MSSRMSSRMSSNDREESGISIIEDCIGRLGLSSEAPMCDTKEGFDEYTELLYQAIIERANSRHEKDLATIKQLRTDLASANRVQTNVNVSGPLIPINLPQLQRREGSDRKPSTYSKRQGLREQHKKDVAEIAQLKEDLAFANQQKVHYERLFTELLTLADPLAEWVSGLVAVRIPPVNNEE